MSQKDHSLTESQIAALVGPRTREVMDAFLAQGPMSIPVLQGVLQMSSKTIYYQVAKLVDVGLLLSSGGDPVVYAAVADKLRMPAGYQGARYERLTARMVGAGLRRAMRRFEQVALASPVDPTLIDDQYYLTGTVKLTPESRAAFHRELQSLVSKYSEGEGRLVSYVFVQSPRVEE